ncbi:oxidoreductase FAD-binding domain-containing protein [Trichoderma breve]|uniref:Oxidoreductase FAD-binding domain-containing protein n=1 Tax=Trichoderma breve TaxID=2034170 RepID=A0A9W9JRX5_9HYPO|nr:oxidoreductase FAD-binding domain-containing protein [Trichoderma breve]KAJ4863897.1 oxidoreductase FAD-binding domain-containing protein [Trichoderma breve]
MSSRRAVLSAARLDHFHLKTSQSLISAFSTTARTASPSTRCLRQYSTASQSQSHSRPVKKSRKIPIFITTAILGGTIYYFSSPSKPTLLNSETFIPYTITSREAISPTSFIFTISPHTPNPSLPYLTPSTSSWRYPLWSVEFKQPQVQIARHYTPLPPQESEDPADGSLRFYVRAIGGGEMSTYLSRLGVGHDVWLRGPHVGFDVTARLGAMDNIVFLAGGTGVVPAMQVAKAVLEKNPDAQVNLLWAIRKRGELQRDPSPIATQLRDMKTTYGQRLRIQVAIDEEQTQFREADLQNAISGAQDRRLLANRSITGSGCRLHDSALLELTSEFETPASVDDCKCGHGAGKNLFMVSGPDGFIAHYAGSKRWLGGQQVQGPVGGVAAQLQRRYPSLADDWLVLKL